MPPLLTVENDVHLWFLPRAAPEVEQLCADGVHLLAPEEVRRYRSYANSRRAKQFLLGRILMRRSLAAHLPGAADAFRFSYGPNGKPKLDRAAAGELVFSLSHAQSSAVMAIAAAERIGVDVEMLSRASSVLGIARQFFSEAEKRQLDAQGSSAKQAAIALWGLKESVVKASGSTIWEGLSGVELALEGEHIRWLSAPPDGAQSNWLLLSGRYQAGYALALALKRSEPISKLQKVHTHVLGNAATGARQFTISSASGLVAAG